MTKTQLTTKQKTETALLPVAAMCAKAHELIESGANEDAAAALGSLWQGPGVKPEINAYSLLEQAEILLTAGVLTSRLAGPSAEAKTLLADGAALFQQAGDQSHWAQAQSNLAACHRESGDLDEARATLQDTLEAATGLSAEAKGGLIDGLAQVEIAAGHYRQADIILGRATGLAESLGDSLLKSDLYARRAKAQSLLAEISGDSSYLSRALDNYRAALGIAGNAGNAPACASLNCQLGATLAKQNQYSEALGYLDQALNVFLPADDKKQAGAAYNVKAQVYLAQNNLADAEKAATDSVSALGQGEAYDCLAESLTTLGKVYARQDSLLKAQHTFDNAFDVADNAGDKEAAGVALLTGLEELAGHTGRNEFQKRYRQAEDLLGNSTNVTILRRLRKLAQMMVEKYASESPDVVINLPQTLHRTQAQQGAVALAATQGIQAAPMNWEGFSLPKAVLAFEAGFIRRALQDTQGRVTQASQLLGISHQNLSLQLTQRHSSLSNAKRPRRKRGSLKKA